MIWIFGVALASLALDAGVKLAAANWLRDGIIRLGWLVELRCTYNTGMALGIFSDNALAGLLLPLTVILCGWWLMRRYQPTRFTLIACGLVLGGFAGNYGERLLFGRVLDMIYFPFLPWFVCNIADICICAGVALLAFSLLFRPDDWVEKNKEDAKDAEN